MEGEVYSVFENAKARSRLSVSIDLIRNGLTMRNYCSLLLPIFLFLLLCCAPVRAESPMLRVGVSLPLTGPWAEFGDAVRNGIEMARAEQPNSFARLEFVYDDSAYDPKRAVSALQKFIDVDKVDLVFVWGNEPALAVAPVAQQRKVPTIAVAQFPQFRSIETT